MLEEVASLLLQVKESAGDDDLVGDVGPRDDIDGGAAVSLQDDLVVGGAGGIQEPGDGWPYG